MQNERDINTDDFYMSNIFKKRIFYILVFFVCFVVILIYRLFYLQVIHHDELLSKSRAQQRREIILPATKGNILDRDGNLYAASIDAYSLYADPTITIITNKQVNDLSALLNIRASRIIGLKRSRGSFVWMKRKLTQEEAEAFDELRYKGVYHGYDKYKQPYVYVNGSMVQDKERYASFLSKTLSIDYDTVLNNLNKYKEFFTVKKDISQKELLHIKAETYYGFELLREDKRVYLKDNRASHVIGYVGIDNQGLSGIEYQYNSLMKGKDGRLIVENDRKGNQIYMHTRQVQLPSAGRDVHLTIDNYIQYIVEKELAAAVKSQRAISAQAIVMNPQTGEILAMAICPDFKPELYYKYDYETLVNKCVSFVYEPGSTMKVITVATALDVGVVNAKTLITCPPKFKYGSRVISEAHDDNKERILTPTEIIKDSVNIGAAKIGLLVGAENLYDSLKRFGFGSLTGVELPGESQGILRNYTKWHESDKAIIPFGHAISVTTLQMITGLGAICNDGVLLKPFIVKRITGSNGQYIHTTDTVEVRRVVSKETASKMREMMRRTVVDGTGTLAAIPGYSIFGKTGTAWKIDSINGGYKYGAYITSFFGGLPKDNPSVIILVIIDEPTTTKYASTTAVPVFRNIMEKIINYMNIPPDLPIDNKENITSSKEEI